MMRYPTFLFHLVATISAIALPQSTTIGDPNDPSTNGVEPPFATNTTTVYYQGPTGPIGGDSESTCNEGHAVGTGTLQTEMCSAFCTDGISIAAAPESNCTFTLYTGTSTCDVGSAETASGGEQIQYVIPAGSGPLCVDTGVLDGCQSQFASGVWSCG